MFDYQLELILIFLVLRLRDEFRQIKKGDLFCVRVKNTSPSVWQRQDDGSPRLLFRVPTDFCDSFVCLQEWEMTERTRSQSVRIDFLNRVQLPPTCPFESPAYWSRLREATLGGQGQINRQVQKYHVVEKIFTPSEAREILSNLGFFSQSPVDQIREAFRPLTNHLGDQPRVLVPELMDTVEQVPQANLTADACVMMQHLRHQRFIRRRYGRSLGN